MSHIDGDKVTVSENKIAYFCGEPVTGSVAFWYRDDNSVEVKAKRVTEYIDGMKDGRETHYSKDERVTMSNHYKKNKFHGFQRINHSNGRAKIISELENNKKVGEYMEFDILGNIIRKSIFSDGKRHGSSKTFDSRGNLTLDMFYVDGKKHGSCKEFENGNLTLECFYVEGKYHGVYKEFDSKGILTHECFYKEGKHHGVYKRYVNGQLILDAIYEEGVLISSNL